ncbi:MAG: DNA-3-methyladenine glycosylase I [Candidatus Omnitrophica bacterium]|nr:DNA-3-methyladenine glycosylase I [Candidatus Omnitrophota bacterium]
MNRCNWATSEILIDYHDHEWGILSFEDIAHFEHISLSGFQAGLSWELILKKRAILRRMFSAFDPYRIAKFNQRRINNLLEYSSGIKNEKKIRSVINNAKAFISIRDKYGSFSRYLFSCFGNQVKVNRYKKWEDTPSFTKDSIKISNLLKKEHFSFLGPTITYAYLQAVGFVDDHIEGCFRKNRNKVRDLIR